MELGDIKAVYFVGIGGIGMSALARFFASRGVRVSGYDKTATGLTKQLEEEGIKIYFDECVERVPKDVELVVYTPAIPADHKELQYYRSNGYRVVKRSDVLQIITNSSLNICVAGTHGKTTISTMTAYILQASGHGCNAFLGGISANYDTNFWSSTNPLCVVEADEYDRSFHKLSPDFAVVSSMDPDHLDIYGTADQVEEAFITFTEKIRKGGTLLYKYGLKRAAELKGDNRLSYHAEDLRADVHVENLRINNGGYIYDVVIKKHRIKDVSLRVGGLHNVENSLPAITLAHLMNISDEKIKEVFSGFSGVKRRFEYWIAPGQGDSVLIDDYAHHPEELRALLSSARSLFSDYSLMILFQPHLFSRTRDLAEEFAESLDMADSVILLPIYPARELPVEGVNSMMILERMRIEDKVMLDKDEVFAVLAGMLKDKKMQKNKWTIITAGAGDIDTMLPRLKEILTNG